MKIKIESIEQITYEEFIHSIPNPTILTVFKMLPLNGSILFETNPQFVYQVIDILLGGNGDRKYKLREFTDIDKNIIKQINQGLISNMRLAWEDIIEVEPEIEGLETNPALNQTLAPTEPVALISFSVEIGRNTSFIHICIPYLSIEKVLDKLVVQYWFQQADDTLLKESRDKLKDRLKIVDVDITAILGDTHITVDDFLRLSIGDVIPLDNKTSSAIKVLAEDQQVYYARPGIVNKSIGIEILDIIDKDVENYE